jgi:rsbT co-antagonist protein RsbR
MSDGAGDSTTPTLRTFRAGQLDWTWSLATGSLELAGFPVTAFFRDSSLASLLRGFQAMVGEKRFALAQQSEGQKGIAEDWSVIGSCPTFEEGFAQLSAFAAEAGWGRWQLVSIDREKKELRIRVSNSWEGKIQKSLGVSWGSGLVAGKFAAFAEKVFGVNCWTTQVKAIADGEDYDEFIAQPSDRNIDAELAALVASDEATRADLAVALKQLQSTSTDRDRMVTELTDKLSVIEAQNRAIQAMSTPILQVWDGVLALPIIGMVDEARASLMTETLLGAIVETQARFAILDLTGVDVVDTSTANNFLKIVAGTRLLGAHALIAGIRPMVAQTISSLGVDLGTIATFGTLKAALQHCIAEARR